MFPHPDVPHYLNGGILKHHHLADALKAADDVVVNVFAGVSDGPKKQFVA